LLLEADSAADAFRAIDACRAAGAGFFKLTKAFPVLTAEELIPISAEIQQALGSS